ncbi:sensor histidine kinase [Arenibaculum pallidiluteum]|uniref:sensor histidine kinase n=1 Tax=Arenibaculum pallidiluteum TaxID=2812559 RepID=UPI001A97561E|nr:PAS domain S-box protein [Arenibaculum pallidiluteum]
MPSAGLPDAWDALPEAALAWDGAGRILRANAAAQRLFGAPMLGDSLDLWLPGLIRGDGAAAGPGLAEAEARQADGGRFPAEIALGVAQDGVVFALVRDMTERRRLEAARAQLGDQRFRDFAETASDWLWETGPDHRFTYLSDALLASECLGHSRIELTRREPGDEPAWDDHHADLAAHRPFRDFQHVMMLRATGLRYVSVNGRPVFDPDGSFRGYRGSATDITEAVLWRRMRAETEIRLKAILEAALDGIVTVGVNGGIESFNPAAERIFGYRPGEVIGRNLRMLIPGAWSDQAGPAALVGSGRLLTGRREDGTAFPLELSVSEADLAGEGRFYVAILRDVTERRRVEQELETYREHLENLVEQRTAALGESEARLRSILSSSVVPMVVAAEADGSLRFANEAASRLLGFAGELAGGTDAALYGRPEDRALVTTELARRGRVLDLELRLRKRDGGGFWASLSAIPMRFDGDPCVLLTCIDISRRKESELAMVEALQKEKSLNEQQQRFFSMASHEFRTPLAIIDTVTQMLSRFDDALSTEERRQEYDTIRAAVARMTNLMESVLSASRAEAGTLRLNLTEVDLPTLLREAVKRQQLIAPDHRIDLDVTALPATLRGDARLLEQVLANLLSNAVKYSPERRPIKVTGTARRGEAVIAVQDRGIGIPKAEMGGLFRKYFRASTGATIAGTGIGLHLVQLVVGLHQGRVAVESVEGEGSTFTVALPLEGPSGEVP